MLTDWRLFSLIMLCVLASCRSKKMVVRDLQSANLFSSSSDMRFFCADTLFRAVCWPNDTSLDNCQGLRPTTANFEPFLIRHSDGGFTRNMNSLSTSEFTREFEHYPRARISSIYFGYGGFGRRYLPLFAHWVFDFKKATAVATIGSMVRAS